ncbi:hypothetical protein BWZ20_14880 [Winogradskyella sp. J14-2]|uniref:hypothetical protein n=1 Tax=Winogradskyella sp. J14-2 TaxID=1936080 RepID=UPI000972D790|nr:hypothetical protein [Winogradskyella sp. J14-2]APY09508.1 hypothetical protein BWZ20_14880 [Winogradskyella sp. J14-2]
MLKNGCFLALILTLICVSCEETEILNNIRVLVKGKVLDQNGVPLPNANIEVYTDANVFSADRVLVGLGESDAFGNFKITSLFGPNELFYIDVSLNSQFSEYRYLTNTEEFTPQNLIFDLETLQLNALTTFTYNIVKVNEASNTLQYNFMYLDPNCTEFYEEGVLNTQLSNCNVIRNRGATLNNLSPNAENASFKVPLQSQIEFTYSLNGGDTISEIITVNEDNYEFTFNY